MCLVPGQALHAGHATVCMPCSQAIPRSSCGATRHRQAPHFAPYLHIKLYCLSATDQSSARWLCCPDWLCVWVLTVEQTCSSHTASQPARTRCTFAVGVRPVLGRLCSFACAVACARSSEAMVRSQLTMSVAVPRLRLFGPPRSPHQSSRGAGAPLHSLTVFHSAQFSQVAVLDAQRGRCAESRRAALHAFCTLLHPSRPSHCSACSQSV